jgi:hypothetical protein
MATLIYPRQRNEHKEKISDKKALLGKCYQQVIEPNRYFT